MRIFIFVCLSLFSFAGCLGKNSIFVTEISDFLLKPKLNSSHLVFYGTVLGTAYGLEKIFFLRETIDQPSRYLMKKMQEEALFEEDKRLNLILDASFSVKNKLKINEPSFACE